MKAAEAMAEMEAGVLAGVQGVLVGMEVRRRPKSHWVEHFELVRHNCGCLSGN